MVVEHAHLAACPPGRGTSCLSGNGNWSDRRRKALTEGDITAHELDACGKKCAALVASSCMHARRIH